MSRFTPRTCDVCGKPSPGGITSYRIERHGRTERVWAHRACLTRAQAAAPLDACPRCGGTVTLVTDGAVGVPVAPAFQRRSAAIPIRWLPRPFVACSTCEYCAELPNHQLKGR
jgi:hypothetical protein